MQLRNRLLDYRKRWALPHVALFTGNEIVKRNGALVMGRGAARMVRDHYSNIDRVFGELITKHPDSDLLWATVGKNQHLGWFRVKHHWADNADLILIKRASDALRLVALRKPDVNFHLNYPGVGNGKLTEAHVEPLLATLPDNVWVYR